MSITDPSCTYPVCVLSVLKAVLQIHKLNLVMIPQWHDSKHVAYVATTPPPLHIQKKPYADESKAMQDDVCNIHLFALVPTPVKSHPDPPTYPEFEKTEKS